MEFREKNGSVIARLFPGEELVKGLKDLCGSLGGETYVVVSAVGQIVDSEVGYFVSKGDYSPEVFEGPLELLGLSGIINLEGEEYIPHLHVILGDREKNVHGGHLLMATVSITAEIALLYVPIPVNRVWNEELGMKEMRIP